VVVVVVVDAMVVVVVAVECYTEPPHYVQLLLIRLSLVKVVLVVLVEPALKVVTVNLMV
jgi:hypothetical protein